MEKKNRLLIALFALSLIIRIIFLFATPLKIWDETVYANLGYDLSRNPLDYSFANNGWSDYIPSKDNFYAWPKAGFRAPLLPYSLSLLYLFNLDFLIVFFLPIIGALSVVFVYFLAKKLFNDKVALFSSLLFSFIPVHVVYSSKILTDVFTTFFIILTFISFWKGYEENNRKHKVLFGFFLALSLLARYTALWIAPIFLIYFLIRNVSLKFLKDRYLWYSVLVFFMTLAPWFLYSYFAYSNPLGAFIHGFKASAYWGGVQPWNFYLIYWLQIASVIGVIFAISLIYIFYKKEFIKKEVYLLLIWTVFFLLLAMLMPHKEDRFILPIIPPICILSGFILNKLTKKNIKLISTSAILIILILSLGFHFNDSYKKSYTGSNICFLEGNKFLNKIKEKAVVITDESPVVYYYSKKETHFYPSPWSFSSFKNLVHNNYKDENVYLLFFGSDIYLNEKENIHIKQDLDSNFEKVFECHKDDGLSIVYKYSH